MAASVGKLACGRHSYVMGCLRLREIGTESGAKQLNNQGELLVIRIGAGAGVGGG